MQSFAVILQLVNVQLILTTLYIANIRIKPKPMMYVYYKILKLYILIVLPVSLSLAAEGVDDVKVKAVNEMMERIKHGVVLRPVKSQESKVRTGFKALRCILYSGISCRIKLYPVEKNPNVSAVAFRIESTLLSQHWF